MMTEGVPYFEKHPHGCGMLVVGSMLLTDVVCWHDIIFMIMLGKCWLLLIIGNDCCPPTNSVMWVE